MQKNNVRLLVVMVMIGDIMMYGKINHYNQDGVWLNLVAGFILFAIGLFLQWAKKNLQYKSGKMIQFILLLGAIIYGIYEIIGVSWFVNVVGIHKTAPIYVIGLFLTVSLFLSLLKSKGLNYFVSYSKYAFVFVIIMFFIGSALNGYWGYLLPMFSLPFPEYAPSLFKMIGFIIQGFMVLLISDDYQSVNEGIVFGSILSSAIYLFSTILIGNGLNLILEYPFYYAVSIIKVSEFVQRIEIFVTLYSIFSCILVWMIIFRFFQKIFPKQYVSGFAILCIGLIWLTSKMWIGSQMDWIHLQSLASVYIVIWMSLVMVFS